MTEAKFVYSCFHQIMSTPMEKITDIGDIILIPKFEESTISALIDEAKDVLKKGSPVEEVDGEVCVVGDIHGNFFDLIRIFAKSGYPPNTKYVFLGDYVDRGQMSLEVICFLVALKVLFPLNIFLLRGNHEFIQVNRSYGFRDSVMHVYQNDNIWCKFNKLFEFLPIAAVVNKKIFCVHGGISDRITTIKKLSEIQFPIIECPCVTDMTWSDPTENFTHFNESQRGKGCLYGYKAVSHFLDYNNLKMIIRSHECVDGYRTSFDNSLLTIFSCSNYSHCENHCGYALVDAQASVSCMVLDVLVHDIPYEDLNFYDAIKEQKHFESIGLLKSQSKDLFVIPGGIKQSKSYRKWSFIKGTFPLRTIKSNNIIHSLQNL